MNESAIHIDGLTVTYPNGARALRGVELLVEPGERIAVVGESGCGKTTLVRALLGLLPPSARIGGSIRVGSIDVVGTPDRRLRRLRGEVVGYVPQNPLAAFDPLRSVGHQLREVWRSHGQSIERTELVERLDTLRVADAATMIERRPAAWSGGMLQRACLLAALALEPPIVLADEPTSALDRPLASALLGELCRGTGTVVMVTHDLDLLDDRIDRVVVMYAGRVVEDRSAGSLLSAPRHPYTAGLLAALPRPGRLPAELPGDPPPLIGPDDGCAFAARCERAGSRCRESVPDLLGGVRCIDPLVAR